LIQTPFLNQAITLHFTCSCNFMLHVLFLYSVITLQYFSPNLKMDEFYFITNWKYSLNDADTYSANSRSCTATLNIADYGTVN
jgi:hypothetical protein